MSLSERWQHIQLPDKPYQPKVAGRLVRMVGLTLEAVGLSVRVGDRCMVERKQAEDIEAEVVGFDRERIFLMPIEQVDGLRAGARVWPLSVAADVPVGFNLLGRVLDGTGRPLDQKGPLQDVDQGNLQGRPINPLHRAPIRETLDVGIRAINALLTVGRGQRIGLFAGSGVGKSVLLGMMTRFTQADIIVVGLIGERGREVKEFIDEILGEEGLSRSVVVASPADDSPLMRLRAAQYCTSVAEYFRDQGQNVLLLMDSLTRYAQAQREIALAVGEPPATKGYPPSVFNKLPKLVERTGNGQEGGGSITAFYTVLSEGDDMQDPIADASRAILDGHIVLSRKLAEEGHYPAIDVEASVSRVMPQIVSEQWLRKAQLCKQLMSHYRQNQDLISVGAYQPGSDNLLDVAIERLPKIKAMLRQSLHEGADMAASEKQLNDLFPSPPQAKS
ncbi:MULTISPECIES: flagellar protein export ATPase FliI [unclassified Thalassolituus]|jgi:flagellum-specific ATP synthase|uniref:flagellar protein export ATPase FliI n=1 Tax=unclassified Thalassolituus TaxID=2624967 RepID=UPI001CE34306|nr:MULTISPECIES: flagellar protein export ATPase FliI [unclassified Thalassolituus]MBU2037919.1 flagellar protein export ATPase FliI [Gammaproteobacteria bacterium]MCA6061916.1 flagellar protein export ATPase FliI [Thalassolituus sp. ST750PaO-4]